jgi:hypothetical protein
VITPNGSDIFYGNKDADGCKLDFDANVSEGETDPCENVSCKPGAFVIRVDNYTRRTKGDIHFHVICQRRRACQTLSTTVCEVSTSKRASGWRSMRYR